MVGQREFRGKLLVDIDAETGGLVYVHVAVLDSGTPGEDFSRFVVETDAFLNPEVRNRKVEMRIGGVPYRRNVPRPVPGGADIEPFA